MKLFFAVAIPVSLIINAMVVYVPDEATPHLKYTCYDQIQCRNFSFRADAIHGASHPLQIMVTNDAGKARVVAAQRDKCFPTLEARRGAVFVPIIRGPLP